MIQVSKLITQGAGLAPALLKRFGTVALDWDVRQKSRFDCTDSTDRQLGVFLPRGTVVRGGDVLVAEDGTLVKIIAAPQKLLHITYCRESSTPYDLIRAAYHLGNRHVQIELKPDHLKIEPDHVLADMLRAMHLIVSEVSEGFEPEAGAYGNNGHGHAGRAHEGSHAHDDSHAHDSAHAHAPSAAHVHGPDCNHGDDHSHSRTTAQPVHVSARIPVKKHGA